MIDLDSIIKDPLYATDTYALGTIIESDEKDLVGYYGLVNKETGVCEFASPQLPICLATLLNAEQQLKAAKEDFMEESKPKIVDQYTH